MRMSNYSNNLPYPAGSIVTSGPVQSLHRTLPHSLPFATSTSPKTPARARTDPYLRGYLQAPALQGFPYCFQPTQPARPGWPVGVPSGPGPRATLAAERIRSGLPGSAVREKRADREIQDQSDDQAVEHHP